MISYMTQTQFSRGIRIHCPIFNIWFGSDGVKHVFWVSLSIKKTFVTYIQPFKPDFLYIILTCFSRGIQIWTVGGQVANIPLAISHFLVGTWEQLDSHGQGLIYQRGMTSWLPFWPEYDAECVSDNELSLWQVSGSAMMHLVKWQIFLYFSHYQRLAQIQMFPQGDIIHLCMYETHYKRPCNNICENATVVPHLLDASMWTL